MADRISRLTSFTPVWRQGADEATVDAFRLESWALAERASVDRDAEASEGGRRVRWIARRALAVIGALGILAGAVAVVALAYVVKSSLGINFFDEPSFLHDWLYVPRV